jgi:hypothetical protein
MAEQNKEKTESIADTTNVERIELREDEIITRLVPNPVDPPDVISLVGFLGRSPRPRFWRLYHTLDLKNYTEIAESDIVLTESLESKLQTLGGTIVWVKSGARLQHTRSESRQAESEFMQGDLASQFLPGTGLECLSRKVGGQVLMENPTGPVLCLPPSDFIRGRWVPCINVGPRPILSPI